MLTIDPVRTLLGIADDSQDALLEVILAGVEETILNYCHLDEVPAGLTYTAARMAADMYRQEGYGSAAGPSGNPASITEGDTTVSFRDASASGAYGAYAEGIIKNYTVQLNRYRRMVRSCCRASQGSGETPGN